MSKVEERLSLAQQQALAEMPVYLTPDGHLPPGAPHGNLIRALARRNLIAFTGDAWVRRETESS